MNLKRYLFAVAGVFAFVFVFETAYHGFLMKGFYNATASVWRPEEQYNMAVMLFSQFLFAAAMTLAYANFAKHLPCKKGIMFGALVGLIFAMPALGTYSYLPIPLKISLLWMLAEFLKCLGCGIVIAAICKE